MDDVQLRYNLLEKAQSLMLSEWEHKVKVEEASARFESRNPVVIKQPTLHRIMVLAEKFYGFVKAPPANPSNPISPSKAAAVSSLSSEATPEGVGEELDLPEEVEELEEPSEE